MLAATYGPTMIVCGGTSGVPWPLAYQYYNAWSACEKLAWQVPRATHTYFVDQTGLDMTMAGVGRVGEVLKIAVAIIPEARQISGG